MLVFVSQILTAWILVGHLLTLEFDMNSGMAIIPGGTQVSDATGSSGWLGATDIPVQQGSVGFTGPTGVQGRPGIIVLL